MSVQENIQQPVKVMQSPSMESLELVLFKSKEGIEQLGVTTYEGMLTFKELVQHTVVEANTDVLSEELKKQRDVDKPRVEGLKKYWKDSDGAVFPNMTFFANNLIINSTEKIGNRELVRATLDKFADRFISDGQGRKSFIDWLLTQEGSEKFEDHTISFKLIVTHTDTLSTPKASKIVKQVFADYHVSLKKPNKSISKYFDSASPFARLLNELMEVEVNGKLQKYIALHGKINRGQLWTFDQFTAMIQKFLKVTPSTANKMLACDETFQSTFELCEAFLCRVMNILPVEQLDVDDFEEAHERLMFTKAIFVNALGYVGRSLFDEMLLDESKTWESLKQLDFLQKDKKDKFWIKSKITMNDEGAIRIIKGTDKRFGALICRELRIFPCSELSA